MPGGRVGIALVVMGLLGVGWGMFEAGIRTDWMAERIKAHLLSGIEEATGGSVSIEQVRIGDSRLSVEIEGLEVSDPDDPSAPPFLAVPQASGSVSLWSLVRQRAHLESLSVREPHLRVRISDDGSSNISVPARPSEGSGIAIRDFNLTGGVIEWNGEPFGMEFSGSGLEVVTSSNPKTGRYEIEARLMNPSWDVAGLAVLHGSSLTVVAAADEDGIELREAELDGDDLTCRVEGRLRNLESPSFDGSFSATAQLAPLLTAADYGLPLVSATMELNGSVNWSLASGELNYDGTVVTRDLTVPRHDIEGSLRSSFAGTQDEVMLHSIVGTVLDGTVDGALAVRQLRGVPTVWADGLLSGIPLIRIAEAAGSGPIPWDGIVDVDFSVSGPSLQDLAADVEVVVLPAGGPTKLPVEGSGSFQFNQREGTVSVSGVQIRTPNTEVSVRGQIDDVRQGILEIEAATTSLQALERILATVQPQPLLPRSMPDGRFGFRGQIQAWLGPDPFKGFRGEISVEDFEVAGERWERLVVQCELSRSAVVVHDGELVDGEGRLDVRGTLPLDGSPRLELSLTGDNMDAAKLVRASGFAIPIDGLVSASIDLSGSLADPVATSRIRMRSPSFFGERFGELEAQVNYSGARFELSRALLVRGPSHLSLAGSVDRPTQEITLRLVSNRWSLGEFDWGEILMPGLTGTLQFDLEASGVLGGVRRLSELELSGSWELAEMQEDGLSLGHWTGEIESLRDQPNIDLHWSANILGGVIRGSADVGKVQPSQYSGEVEFREISTSMAARFLDLPTEAVDGTLTGSAEFAGILGGDDTFELSGTIDHADLRIAGLSAGEYALSNVFPMRWGIREGSLRLDSMTMTGPGTEFEIDGQVDLGGVQNVNLSLGGSVNPVLLQAVMPGLALDGGMHVGLRILGNVETPTLDGSVELVDAILTGDTLPFRLNDINGTIRLENGVGAIEHMTATSGGGTISFEGALSPMNAGPEYRLQATAKDVRLDYPANVSSVVDGEFTLTGTGLSNLLNGALTISRVSLQPGQSFGELFGSLGQPQIALTTASSAFLDTQVEIHIGAVSQLPVETDLVRDVEADLDLKVMGTIGAPSILGTIGIAQGEIRMLGTHYQISRGDIRFVNPLQIEPVLDFELETRIRDTDLALVLSGPALALNLSYRSDPPLAFHDLVSLIVVGKEPTVDPSIASERRLSQQSLVQTGADTLLREAIARPVSKRLQRFFGVSRLKVDPQIGGLEANPSARISTEQQIAEQLTLIYSYDLSSAQQQSIRIEWNPDRRWSFIVARDQNGLVGSDVLYKLRLP